MLLVRRPPRWGSIAAPLAAGWVMATWIAVTMHGWWFPGRHLVHALPCAVLAIAWWLDRIAVGRVVAWAGVVVGVTSSLWLAAQAAFADVTLVFDPWATTDPVLRLMQPLLPEHARPRHPRRRALRRLARRAARPGRRSRSATNGAGGGQSSTTWSRKLVS